MSNFVGIGRSNYVTVEDLDGLEEALSEWPITIESKDGKVALFDDDADGSGWPTFGMDDDGAEIEFDVGAIVMPFVKEGEVLVVMESGHEKARYVTGWAAAYIRQGDTVRVKEISISDIYGLAAAEFGVDKDAISVAQS